MLPSVYTIAPVFSFVDALAQGVLERYGQAPEQLPSIRILLPNRRSCESLREAFLRQTEGRPLLLPRMMPLGDFEEDDSAFLDGADTLPPAISRLHRHILLARLVEVWHRQAFGFSRPDQAMLLAVELAGFLDEVQREQCDIEKLEAIVPDEYAGHWQQTLEFLKIVTYHWPDILSKYGWMDPVSRRNQSIANLTQRWRESPPGFPVIAAGSTGSIPSTAELLGVVARMPKGLVVLPGLDKQCDEEYWQAIGPSHPQAGLRVLLRRMEITRDEVEPWSAYVAGAREALISELMRPAEVTEQWQQIQPDIHIGLEGISHCEFPGLREEAEAIALMLRECLAEDGKTAMLVTPDRALARRVSAAIRKYEIEVDDSAGVPLTRLPESTFLQLIVDAVVHDFAPTPMLSLLRHPLCAAGVSLKTCRGFSRILERKLLRGVRIQNGLHGLLHAARAIDGMPVELLHWLEQIDHRCEELKSLLHSGTASLSMLLTSHLRLAETLATTDEESGDARLWGGERGEVLSQFMMELLPLCNEMGSIDPRHYSVLLDTMMSGVTYRPRYGMHPRLRILSPIEARLQQADLVILGGLNEGSWPSESLGDPWMSRPMRAAFGLPDAVQSVGQEAHDVAGLFSAPKVVLTRATKVDGSPALPSRWLLRLGAVLSALRLPPDTITDDRWLDWVTAIGISEERYLTSQPAPCPPVEARPRELAVSWIERLMRDPYSVYAAKILGLRRLDPLDEDPSAIDFGNIIHTALERYTKEWQEASQQELLERLLACGREAMAPLADRPAVMIFWWPRFEQIAHWFVEEDAKRRNQGSGPIHAEVSGEWQWEAPAGLFALKATADRIEEQRQGVSIHDYKTGEPPSNSAVNSGMSPQLSLEALLWKRGGFLQAGINQTVQQLAYWKLSGGDPAGKIQWVANGKLSALIEEAEQGVKALIAAFDNPATPYYCCPDPTNELKHSDYEHLSRAAAWK